MRTERIAGMLQSLRKGACALRAAEDGPTAAEYAILLAGLVIVAMVAIGGIGSRIFNVYQAINTAVANI